MLKNVHIFLEYSLRNNECHQISSKDNYGKLFVYQMSILKRQMYFQCIVVNGTK